MPKEETGMTGLMAVAKKATVVVKEVLNTACVSRVHNEARQRCEGVCLFEMAGGTTLVRVYLGCAAVSEHEPHILIVRQGLALLPGVHQHKDIIST